MKIRIVHDPKNPWCSRIENAETGEPIEGVRSFTFSHTAHKPPTLTLEFVKHTSVEVVAEGKLEDISEVGDKFTRKRLVPLTPPALIHRDCVVPRETAEAMRRSPEADHGSAVVVADEIHVAADADLNRIRDKIAAAARGEAAR